MTVRTHTAGSDISPFESSLEWEGEYDGIQLAAPRLTLQWDGNILRATLFDGKNAATARLGEIRRDWRRLYGRVWAYGVIRKAWLAIENTELMLVCVDNVVDADIAGRDAKLIRAWLEKTLCDGQGSLSGDMTWEEER